MSSEIDRLRIKRITELEAQLATERRRLDFSLEHDSMYWTTREELDAAIARDGGAE